MEYGCKEYFFTVRRLKKMLTIKKNQKGFTLVELLIVVVILGILAAVAIPRFLTTRDKSQQRACQSNLSAINGAIEEYCFLNNSLDPKTLSTGDLATYVTGDSNRFPDGEPKCPKDSAAYSMNAANGRAECTNNSDFEGYPHALTAASD